MIILIAYPKSLVKLQVFVGIEVTSAAATKMNRMEKMIMN